MVDLTLDFFFSEIFSTGVLECLFKICCLRYIFLYISRIYIFVRFNTRFTDIDFFLPKSVFLGILKFLFEILLPSFFTCKLYLGCIFCVHILVRFNTRFMDFFFSEIFSTCILECLFKICCLRYIFLHVNSILDGVYIFRVYRFVRFNTKFRDFFF